MPKTVEEIVEEQRGIVEQIRTKWEDYEKEKFTKSEALEFEEKANKQYDHLTEELKKIEKIAERVDAIETRMKRPGGIQEPESGLTPEKKAFEKWIRFGRGVLSAEDQKLLKVQRVTPIDPEVLRRFDIPEEKVLTIAGETGIAYLAPGEYVNEIIKGVTEISPVRSLARVKPTSNNFVEIPRRTGQFAAAWTTEIGTKAETEGLEYGMEQIPNHEMYALVKISKHSLEDSAFNLESELTEEFSEQFGLAEGTAFITGNAVGKPEGVLENGDVDKSTVIYDQSDTKLLPDGLIDLIFAPKSAYTRNGTIGCRRATIALMRKMKSTTEPVYYWEPDLQKGSPGVFMGYPIVEMPDVPACADGAYSMIFGDWRRGYVISDRIQIEVQRLVELYAESNQVGFIARKRVGGQVVLAEALWAGVGQA